MLMRSGQRGMSLIELMIALTMGLFLLLGLSTFLTTTLKSNTAAVRLASLDQELRAIMTLMARDVRRAGYWGGPTGAISGIGSGTAYNNPFANASTNAASGVPVSGGINTATAGCLLYSYDYSGNSSTDSNGFQDPAEKYGFLRVVDANNNGAVVMRGSAAFDCTTAPALSEYLSDQKNTNITALTFAETDSAPVYMNGAAGPNIRTRQIIITITGQPLNDPGIKQTLTETVKIENDLFKQN